MKAMNMNRWLGTCMRGGSDMKPFKLIPVSVLIGAQYKSQWLIKDYMEVNSLGMLFGAPGRAKAWLEAESITWIEQRVAERDQAVTNV